MSEEIKNNPDDLFSGSKEVKPGKFNWGKVGDFIIGYFVGSQEIETENGLRKLYEIKAVQGLYHEVENTSDENGNKIVKVSPESISLEVGEFYNVWGRDDIDKFFHKVKIGQKVGLQFKEVLPSKKKGYSPFKVIKTALWDEFDKTDEEIVAESGI